MLNDRALITIPEGRRYCFRNEADTGRDQILADAINDVSDSIWDYLEREPKPTTGTTALDGGIDDNDTALDVDAIDDVPAAPFEILIGAEILTVTDTGAGTDWTVGRAARDSEAAAHADAATVTLLEERIFRYAGAGTLDLAPYDLRDLAAVTFYTDLDADRHTQLVSSQYRLEPRGRARGGTYLALTVPAPSIAEAEPGFGWQGSVLGSWGMAETPGPIKLACKQWVDNIVRNPGSYASQTMSGYTVTPEFDDPSRAAGMPAAVRHRLERWRRHRSQGLTVVRFGRQDNSLVRPLPTV